MRTPFLLLLSLIVIVSCTQPQRPSTTKTIPADLPAKVKVVFNIPSMVGKNMDQILKALASDTACKPQDVDEPTTLQKSMLTEWTNYFVKDGYQLEITYFLRDRAVKEIFLLTNDPSGRTRDYKKVLSAGNLEQNNPNYTATPFSPFADKSLYTGISITKN